MRIFVLLPLVLAACQSLARPERVFHGTLIAIGGGLDNDSRAVYQRFLQLAGKAGPARIVVLTAATGDEEQEVVDKGESLRVWQPGVQIDFARRELSTDDTVALIDRATALFFTGGDQKRIVDRYRPDGRPTPELEAMHRLLERGGVIAGASAGDAMLGRRMLLTGRSAAALGIAPAAPADGEPLVLGPQVGAGMGFLPWLITDSHFFERDRVGRLVAALEHERMRFGIGVGEDAAVEIDLASGDLIGLTSAESLFVDITNLKRSGTACTGLRAWRVREGTRISILDRMVVLQPPAAPPPPLASVVPVVEAGQNRQLASWRQFAAASVPGSGRHVLQLDGWQIEAWSDGGDGIAFTLGPRSTNN